MEKNVLGESLMPCCEDNHTGFLRNGYCQVTRDDVGNHSVCAIMTETFLSYTKAQGNDLSTPMPEYMFPGLKPGDRWCICAGRWEQARLAGCAPKVFLAATSEACLAVVSLSDLQAYAQELA